MIVYKITNTANNKVYIGQTISLGNIRWLSHRAKLRRNVHLITEEIRKNISEAAKIGWVKRKASKVVNNV